MCSNEWMPNKEEVVDEIIITEQHLKNNLTDCNQFLIATILSCNQHQ